ncbi:hypothetical protein MASR2M78_07420 [Treponema sp.]
MAGGGAYGLAHIGVIKVIEELGIPIDMVVGTSMGAIVGGFYAMGYDYKGLEKIARETDWFDVLNEQKPRQSDSLSEAEDESVT